MNAAAVPDEDYFDAHEDSKASDEKFIVRNNDTGEVYDIRELEQYPVDDKYSFFPPDFLPEASPSNGLESRSKHGALRGLKKFRKKAKPKPEPDNPNAIQVMSSDKNYREFQAVELVQVIAKHEGPIWAMKFSLDGLYLATGGQDAVLRVWKVESDVKETQTSPSERKSQDAVEDEVDRVIFMKDPERSFLGHTAPVIDVSWSRSSFILSASMDKTVRLWHISREDCLQVFQHPDSVPAVDFHPKEDRCFLSGCFDNKVRLWDIPEGKVTSWAQTPVMITAATFNPSGTMAVVGLLNGQCTFYQSETLNYYTQIECRNQHGPLKGGRKVTGIQFAPGGRQLLVTTNDSRMRMFNIDDYSRICKYKGMANDNLQIKGSFSQDGEHIICGSENGHVYLWNTRHQHTPSMNIMKGHKPDRNKTFEHFCATSGPRGIATVAAFAPASTFAMARARRTSADDDIHHSASTHYIVVASYDGCIKIFEKTS